VEGDVEDDIEGEIEDRAMSVLVLGILGVRSGRFEFRFAGTGCSD
jgi:hypothetical protein